MQKSLPSLEGADPPWEQPLHAGVDEVGIGPLAGPVVAAAVILNPAHRIDALADSKKLTSRKRELLDIEIRQHALCWALGWAWVAEIDELNILRASHLAMQRACRQLHCLPVHIWVDGNKVPPLDVPAVAVVQGDKLVPQISAASIIAKVARDRYMTALGAQLPDYGFAQHKGYPTKAHIAALRNLGPSEYHRHSFAPVRKALAQGVQPV
ncbi:MAG: ribonuclease HII [bacterium]